MGHVLGFDIDAVLTDEGKGSANIWHQRICNYFDLEEKKKQVYDFTKAYDLQLEEIEEFMETEGGKIFGQVSPYTKAKEVLTNLQKQGNRIILITAREERYNDVTRQWLAEHEIPFDKLIHSQDKAASCQQEDVEAFVDDKLKNLLAIKELEIPVFLMDMDHNHHYEGAIPRVHTWQEIEKKIEEILK
ncbi:5' nucleotidase, NT5C type [Halanaerobaculum tunisiense]